MFATGAALEVQVCPVEFEEAIIFAIGAAAEVQLNGLATPELET